MRYAKIRYSVSGGVAAITLNSPGNLNAFGETMVSDVLAAITASETDDAVKAVVIDAEGKNFSAGGDIGEMAASLQTGKVVFATAADGVARISHAIRKSGKPYIVSVRGAAAGAAFNIALACDFCLAAENARFIQAFVNIGLVPDAGGLFLLSRAVGVNRAMHLAMTGRPVTAAEGEALGFVYAVCPENALAEETAALAGRLASGPSRAYAAMKALVYESQFAGFEQYLTKEVRAQIDAGRTADFREGVAAFREKRAARFTGN